MRQLAAWMMVAAMGLAGCSTVVQPEGGATSGREAAATAAPNGGTPESTVTDTSNLTGTTDMTNLDEISGTGDVTITDELDESGQLTNTNETDTDESGDQGQTTGAAALADSQEITDTQDTGGMGSDTGMAQAILIDTAGQAIGMASFQESDEGVEIVVEVNGLGIDLAGPHGIHIHSVGACTPDFDAAGPHFNPTNMQHGLENAEGPHAGDLPNIEISGDGTAAYETSTDMISLGTDENTIFDADGSAIMIHANPDDLVSDPSGNSGTRIACGVIVPAGVGQ